MGCKHYFVLAMLITRLAVCPGPLQAHDPEGHDAETIQAGPGSLDPSFGGFAGNGKTAGSAVDIRAMALQTDGKIVVTGIKNGTFGLARNHPDGTLDTTFGASGVVMTTILSSQSGAAATAVAVQEDGKIVAAGSVRGSEWNFAVVRYNPNGSLDSSFSGNGKTAPDFDGGDDRASAVAIQPDGKILVAGTAWIGGDDDFAVARFNSDGTLDSSFSGDGKATVGFGDGESASAVGIQPDGKIVLAGMQYNCGDFGCDFDFAVARLNSNGMLDSSFGGDGKTTTGFGADDSAFALALQSDGKIVVAGEKMGNERTFALARYLSNGSLDSTFDGDAKLTVQVGGLSSARGVVVQPDGKIVAAGYGNHQFALARFHSNGTLDSSFGGDGKLFTDFLANASEEARALVLQPDGRLVAAGSDPYDTEDRGYLARYFPDGSLDAAGRQLVAFGMPISDEEAFALAVQPDGKILTAGHKQESTDQFALARLNPDGSLDPSFDGDGRLTFGFGGEERVQAIALQTDGHIVVAGSVTTPNQSDNFMIARFRPDGAFRCFNVTDFESGHDRAFGVAIARDDKIVVVGDVWSVSGGYQMGIARYNSDCSIDTSFGFNGKIQVGFANGATQARAVVVRPDGIIVVVGAHNNDIRLVLLTAEGKFTGSRVTDLGGAEHASALVRQPDGKLLVAGWTTVGGSYDFLLVRYNADGSLDTGFGLAGSWVDNFGGFDSAHAVAVRGDGKIVAAGCSLHDNVERFALVQYRADGTPDTSFNNGGPVFTNFGGTSNCAFGAAFTGDKIVVAGAAQAGNNWNFALAQYRTVTESTNGFSVYLTLVRR